MVVKQHRSLCKENYLYPILYFTHKTQFESTDVFLSFCYVFKFVQHLYSIIDICFVFVFMSRANIVVSLFAVWMVISLKACINLLKRNTKVLVCTYTMNINSQWQKKTQKTMLLFLNIFLLTYIFTDNSKYSYDHGSKIIFTKQNVRGKRKNVADTCINLIKSIFVTSFVGEIITNSFFLQFVRDI